MDQTFRYAELPSPSAIRLLKVDLAHDGDVMHGTLVVTDLDADDRLEYVCLSYTWGSPYLFGRNDPGDPSRWERGGVLKLADSSTGLSGNLLITQNLLEILAHMDRNPLGLGGAAAYIWIDAICINQQDLAERAKQVRLMGNIFESCKQCVIWLGPEDQDTEHVFDMMEALYKPSEEEYKAQRAMAAGQPRPPYNVVLQRLGLPMFSDESWGALGRLFERSWFHRVWTVQECILPRDSVLMCGNFSVGHRCVYRSSILFSLRVDSAIDNLHKDLEPTRKDQSHDQPRGISRESKSAADYVIYFHMRPHHTYELFKQKWLGRAWNWLQYKLCSDPRDYVYAGLGLQVRSNFPVDYQKPVEDIFREFSVEIGVNVRMLLYKEHPTLTRLPGLSSWVPDLSVGRPAIWAARGGNGYKAGGLGNFTYQLVAENKILRVKGLEVDSIQHIGGSFQEMQTGVGLVRSLALLNELKCPTRKGDLIEAFWRTLIADLPGNSRRHPDADVWGPSFRSFCLHYLAKWFYKQPDMELDTAARTIIDSLRQKTASSWLPSMEEITQLSNRTQNVSGEITATVSKEMTAYAMSLKAMFEGRTFFTTRHGRLGIGPIGVDVGNRIFIVQGCGYPLIFRAGDGGRYRLEGHVYIRGIMEGEALKQCQFEDIELE